MKKTNAISLSDFLEEIKQFNVKIVPKVYARTIFHGNSFFERNLSQNEVDFKNYLKSICSNLNLNESCFMIRSVSDGISLFIISKNFIIDYSYYSFNVHDSYCNYLYSFNSSRYDQTLTISNNNFIIREKNNKASLEILHKSNDSNRKDFYFKMKNDTTLSLKSHLNVTSIKFNKDDIFVTFKGTSYSSMSLDYNYNIKEVTLNKNLKSKLNINEDIKYYNIKNYSDLIDKIKVSLNEHLDLFNLMNDFKLELKDKNKKFDQNISYVKEIVKNKDLIFSTLSENKNFFKTFYHHYNNYTKTLNNYLTDESIGNNEPEKYFENHPILSKYKFMKSHPIVNYSFYNYISFFYNNKINNNDFINDNILNLYKKIDNDVINALKFHDDLYSKKTKLKKMPL